MTRTPGRRPGASEGGHPEAGARPPGSQPLWTRDFVVAVGVNALVMTIFYLLMTTMALYATRRFAASDSVAGLASSIFIVGAVIARLFPGRVVTAVGPRRTLMWSLLVFVAMSLAYLLAVDVLLLLAVRLVHGVAFGMANTAVTTAAQAIIPAQRRLEGTGYFSIGAPLAAAIGPLAALLLIARWGYESLFLTCAVLSAVAWVVVLLLLPLPLPRTVRPQPTYGRWWRGMVDRDSLPLASFMLLIGVGSASVLTFSYPLADALGIPAAAATFFAAYAAAVLASRLVVGRLQDVHGDNWVMYPAILTFAAGLVVLSQISSVGGMVVAGILVGLGFGTVMPTAQAAAVARARPQNVGPAVATFYLFLDIGTGFGPVLLGVLVTVWDHGVMFLATGVLVALAAVHYELVHGRRRRAVR